MSNNEKIRKALIRLINETTPNSSFVGKVVASSVDEAKKTCSVEPIDGGPEYFKVRLRPDDEENGITAIPADESYVVVSIIEGDKNNCFIDVFSKISGYTIKLENGKSFEMKNDGDIVFNGGSLGGLVKINPLKAELQKLNTNINLIKLACVTAYTALAALDGSASVNAFNAGTASMQVQDLTQLENTGIKQ